MIDKESEKFMPIYEYQCGQCNHRLESFEKITDAPLTECPVCGKASLQKLISAAGFQLKGTGWYATDFRDNNKKPENKSENKSESKPETKPESKTENKAENKAEPKLNTDSKTKDTAVT